MSIQPGINETFKEAEALYTEQSNAWALAAENLRDVQSRMRAAEYEMELIEGFTRLSPEVMAGKNSEERSAQVLLAVDADVAYSAFWQERETSRQLVARWQDEAMLARDKMAKAKRVMDYCIALVNWRATKGGESDG